MKPPRVDFMPAHKRLALFHWYMNSGAHKGHMTCVVDIRQGTY